MEQRLKNLTYKGFIETKCSHREKQRVNLIDVSPGGCTCLDEFG